MAEIAVSRRWKDKWRDRDRRAVASTPRAIASDPGADAIAPNPPLAATGHRGKAHPMPPGAKMVLFRAGHTHIIKAVMPPPFPIHSFQPNRPGFCVPLWQLMAMQHGTGPTLAQIQTNDKIQYLEQQLQQLGASIATPGKTGVVRRRALEDRLQSWRERAVRQARAAKVDSVEKRVELFATYTVQRATKRLVDGHRDLAPEELLAAVECGAPPDYMFEGTGETVLTTLVLLKQHRLIVPLCKLGASLTKPNIDGWNPLTLAVLAHDPSCTKALLDAGADINFLQPFDPERRENASALMLACARGYSSLVTLLISRRAQLQQRNDKGRTPLMFAARYRQLEPLRLLLNERVDVDQLDNSGFGAADWLRSGARERIIRQAQGTELVDADGWTDSQFRAQQRKTDVTQRGVYALSNAQDDDDDANVARAVEAMAGHIALGAVEEEILRLLEEASVGMARRQADMAQRLQDGMRAGRFDRRGSIMALAKDMGRAGAGGARRGSVFEQVKQLVNAAGGAGGLVTLMSGPAAQVSRRAAVIAGDNDDGDDDDEGDDHDASLQPQAGKAAAPRRHRIIPDTRDWDHGLYLHAKPRTDHLPKQTKQVKTFLDKDNLLNGRPLEQDVVKTATGDAFDWKMMTRTPAERAHRAAAASSDSSRNVLAKGRVGKLERGELQIQLASRNADNSATGLPAWATVGGYSKGNNPLADIIDAAILPITSAASKESGRLSDRVKAVEAVVSKDMLFPKEALMSHFRSATELRSALLMFKRREIENGRSVGDIVESQRIRAHLNVDQQPFDDADLAGYPALTDPCSHCHKKRAVVRCLNCAQRQCDLCCLWIHRQPGSRHHRVKPILPKGMNEGVLLSRQASRLEVMRQQAERITQAQVYLDKVRRLNRRVKRRVQAAVDRAEQQQQQLSLTAGATGVADTVRLGAGSAIIATGGSSTATGVGADHHQALPSLALSTTAAQADQLLQQFNTSRTNASGSNGGRTLSHRDLTGTEPVVTRTPKRGEFRRWIPGVAELPSTSMRRDDSDSLVSAASSITSGTSSSYPNPVGGNFSQQHRGGGATLQQDIDGGGGPPPHIVSKLMSMFPSAAAYIGVRPAFAAPPAGVAATAPPAHAGIVQRKGQEERVMPKQVTFRGDRDSPTQPSPTSVPPSTDTTPEKLSKSAHSAVAGSDIPIPSIAEIVADAGKSAETSAAIGEPSLSPKAAVVSSAALDAALGVQAGRRGSVTAIGRRSSITAQRRNSSMLGTGGVNASAAGYHDADETGKGLVTAILENELQGKQESDLIDRAVEAAMVANDKVMLVQALGRRASIAGGDRRGSIVAGTDNNGRRGSIIGAAAGGERRGSILGSDRRGSTSAMAAVEAGRRGSITVGRRTSIVGASERRGSVALGDALLDSNRRGSVSGGMEAAVAAAAAAGVESYARARRRSIIAPDGADFSGGASSGVISSSNAGILAAAAAAERLAAMRRASIAAELQQNQDLTDAFVTATNAADVLRAVSPSQGPGPELEDAPSPSAAVSAPHLHVVSVELASDTHAVSRPGSATVPRLPLPTAAGAVSKPPVHRRASVDISAPAAVSGSSGSGLFDVLDDAAPKHAAAQQKSHLSGAFILASANTMLIAGEGLGAQHEAVVETSTTPAPVPHPRPNERRASAVFLSVDGAVAQPQTVEAIAERRASIMQIAAAGNKAALANTIEQIKNDVLTGRMSEDQQVEHQAASKQTLRRASMTGKLPGRRRSSVGAGITSETAKLMASKRRSSIAVAAETMQLASADAWDFNETMIGDGGAVEAGITGGLASMLTAAPDADHAAMAGLAASGFVGGGRRGSVTTGAGPARRRSSMITKLHSVDNDGLGGFTRFAGDEDMVADADNAMRAANKAVKDAKVKAVRDGVAALYADMPELKLAVFYTEEGRYAEAEPLFRQALELQMQKLGDDMVDRTVPTLVQFAHMCIKSGDFTQAQRLLAQAADACEDRGLLAGDKRYEEMQLARVELLVRQGENAAALSRLRAYMRQLKPECTDVVRLRYGGKYGFAMTAGKDVIDNAKAADEAIANVQRMMDDLSSGEELLLMAKEDTRVLQRQHEKAVSLAPAQRRASLMAEYDSHFRARRGSVLLGDTLLEDAAKREALADAVHAQELDKQVAATRAQRRASVVKGEITGGAAAVIMADTAPTAVAPPAADLEGIAEASKNHTYQMLIRPTLVEIDTMLSEPRWARMLRKAAEPLEATGQIDFLLAIQTYKGITNPDIAKRNAQFLWGKYMINVGTLPVISLAARKKVEDRMRRDAGRTHVFDDAIVDVRDALVTSVLPRFLASPKGKRYIEERALSMGLPRWTLPQVGKLCEKDRRAQVVWIQGVVRGWLLRMKRQRERLAAEKAGQPRGARSRNPDSGRQGPISTSALISNLGKGFRFASEKAANEISSTTTAAAFGKGFRFKAGDEAGNNDDTSNLTSRVTTAAASDLQQASSTASDAIQGEDDAAAVTSASASIPTEVYQGGLPFDPASLYADEGAASAAYTDPNYSYNPSTGYPDGTDGSLGGYVFDEGSGMYYHAESGWYYDHAAGRYYGPSGEVVEGQLFASPQDQQSAYDTGATAKTASMPSPADYDPAAFYAQTIAQGIDPSHASPLPTAGAEADAAAAAANAQALASERGYGTEPGTELGSAMTPEQAVAYAQYLQRKEARSSWDPIKTRQWAAVTIQRLMRGHLARRRVAAVVDPMWMPKLDPSSGYYYYVNTTTGASQWKLPKYLPYSMVTFKIMCATCEGVLADRHCFGSGCEEAYCAACFKDFHRKGNRALHQYCTVSIGDEVCIECESRLATRTCKECDAPYCSSCYGPVHENSGRGHHTWSESVEPTHVANGPEPPPMVIPTLQLADKPPRRSQHPLVDATPYAEETGEESPEADAASHEERSPRGHDGSNEDGDEEEQDEDEDGDSGTADDDDDEDETDEGSESDQSRATDDDEDEEEDKAAEAENDDAGGVDVDAGNDEQEEGSEGEEEESGDDDDDGGRGDDDEEEEEEYEAEQGGYDSQRRSNYLVSLSDTAL